MSKNPSIYTIHAPDAPKHTGRLESILNKLKAENRIETFSMISATGDLSALESTIEENDMVLILLTNELESVKEQIEQKFRTFKDNHPGVRVAEIIIDNIPYENEFITFPADFSPLRSREDMDRAWNSIELNLTDMFPVSEEKPFPWKTYAKYAAAVLLAAVLIWLIPKIFISGPQAQFTYYVGDAVQDTISSCYAPCNVQFVNESQNFDSSQWEIRDTVLTDRHLRLEFIQPGDIEITLTAFNNSRENRSTKNLLVKSPPTAGFDIQNNGCTAPCSIEFANTSANSIHYSWNFGNGQTSEEENPVVTYGSANEFEVTLTSTNEDGMMSELQQTVTIIADDSPFADFTYSGVYGSFPRTVTFTNQSQNADSYVWQFPGGTPSASSSPNPSVTYQSADTYSVTLIAQKSDGRSHQQVKVVPVRRLIIDYNIQQQLQYQLNATEIENRGFIKNEVLNNQIIDQ